MLQGMECRNNQCSNVKCLEIVFQSGAEICKYGCQNAEVIMAYQSG
jgi:hypothetical protein